METADVIIISGQGGVPLAVDIANEGRNVVLFERMIKRFIQNISIFQPNSQVKIIFNLAAEVTIK